MNLKNCNKDTIPKNEENITEITKKHVIEVKDEKVSVLYQHFSISSHLSNTLEN